MSNDYSNEISDFCKKFGGRKKVNPLGVKAGRPIFTESCVLASPRQYTRILRYFFVKHNITYEYVTLKYREYVTNVLNLDMSDANVSTGKGNLLSAIVKDDVSIKRFEEIMLVLGLDANIGVMWTSPDGYQFAVDHRTVIEEFSNI